MRGRGPVPIIGPAMKPVTYALQFRGVAESTRPGVLAIRAIASGGALTTVLGDDGVRGRYDGADGDEALLEASLRITGDAFDAAGRISFGILHTLQFRATGGRLGPTPDEHLRQGAAVAEIDGGTGQFARATGRITSNFVLSDTGEVTDHQLGVVFLDRGAGIDRGG